MWRDIGNIECQLQWASIDKEDWEFISDEVFTRIKGSEIWNAMIRRSIMEPIVVSMGADIKYRFRWAPVDELIYAMKEASYGPSRVE